MKTSRKEKAPRVMDTLPPLTPVVWPCVEAISTASAGLEAPWDRGVSLPPYYLVQSPCSEMSDGRMAGHVYI